MRQRVNGKKTIDQVKRVSTGLYWIKVGINVKLSFITKRIEQEMDYPGQIKVTVIREMRATATAK